MNTPLLSVRGLTTSFRQGRGWKTVVRDVSFDVNDGETLAVVGESGSGKSVTALSVMRLNDEAGTRTEGQVMFGGENLLDLPETRMRKIRGDDIAMIFQEPMTSLNPVLTVGRQLCETLIEHRGLSWSAARAESAELLEKVRMPSAASRLDDYPHNFSGGMRQRVMIAMALACKPRLLIADEPTTALDVTIQAQTLELIRTLQQENGMAVMFITHDMGVVAEIADRTLVMLRGDVMECGPTPGIFRSPSTTYTRALIAAVPHLGSLSGRPGPAPFPLIDQETGRPVAAAVAAQPRQTDRETTPDAAAAPLPRTTTRTAASTAAEPVLAVKGLTTRFDLHAGLFGRVSGRVHAVENVSFEVAPGETLALVGESGCGKSTTGRSIMRLVTPTSGSVRLAGQELMELSPAQMRVARRNVQMVFQDPYASLNPRIRIGDAIAEPFIVNGLGSRAAALERAGALLGEVGLDAGVMSRFPHEFSGGQRQRICIARALAVSPQLVIADEAVSALDVTVKAQVVNLLLELQERLKLAQLFISHDMAVVERVSHRVAVMYLGEIVEIGPRDAVFSRPGHPYTKRLLAAVPVADPERRHMRTRLDNYELKSPIRRPDYQPPARRYVEAAPGHLVMEWGDDWRAG